MRTIADCRPSTKSAETALAIDFPRRRVQPLKGVSGRTQLIEAVRMNSASPLTDFSSGFHDLRSRQLQPMRGPGIRPGFYFGSMSACRAQTFAPPAPKCHTRGNHANPWRGTGTCSTTSSQTKSAPKRLIPL